MIELTPVDDFELYKMWKSEVKGNYIYQLAEKLQEDAEFRRKTIEYLEVLE